MTKPKGHGEKRTRKRELAALALLTSRNYEEAAAQAGISYQTLVRWRREESFNAIVEEYKERAIGDAIQRIQTMATEALEVLNEIMNDEDAGPSARVTASKAVLDTALRMHEREAIIDRLDKLERMITGGF